MGINNDKYFKPAVRADAGSVAIKTSVALSAIARSLEAIKAGKPIQPEDLAKIKAVSADLEKHFDVLSGWSDDG